MTPNALIAPARLAGVPLLRTQTDERLVDLVRAGNDGAFEAIVNRYRRSLLRYCGALLSEERAEDAVQQTFLRAYDSLRASNAEMQLRPWLYRIAHNTALNVLRDSGPGHEQLSEQIDGVERPDQAFEKSQRLRDVVAAVGELPGRQRDAIVLRELEGRSYEEIAVSIGVTNGAVRQLLNRARVTLRAGATAVTPFGLLARLPWASAPDGNVAARIAEVCGGTAGGAVLAKVCATALVTGAVLGGVAAVPGGGDESKAGPEASRAAALPGDRGERHTQTSTTGGRADRHGALRNGPDRVPVSWHGSATSPSRSKRGSNDDLGDRRDDPDGSSPHSSPGPGDRSGSGGGGSEGPGSGSTPGGSGSGDSGPGSDDSGSGSTSSGPGSGGSTSGSEDSGGGSLSSGPGPGLPDSGLTDTGKSGSGTSGSGSSGSGRRDSDLRLPEIESGSGR